MNLNTVLIEMSSLTRPHPSDNHTQLFIYVTTKIASYKIAISFDKDPRSSQHFMFYYFILYTLIHSKLT